MSSYSFSDEALEDINSICEYIARQNAKAASRIFDAIRERCKTVASFPNIGKSYSWLAPNLRGFVVENYIIFYYPRKDGIDVVKVVSGYRDLESLFLEDE